MSHMRCGIPFPCTQLYALWMIPHPPTVPHVRNLWLLSQPKIIQRHSNIVFTKKNFKNKNKILYEKINGSLGCNRHSGKQHQSSKIQKYSVVYAFYGSYFCKEKLLPSRWNSFIWYCRFVSTPQSRYFTSRISDAIKVLSD